MLEFASRHPSVVVAVVGLIVTVTLYYLGSRRTRMEATFKALALLQEKDARNARFGLLELLTKTPDKTDFGSLSSEDRATISSIAIQFGTIGSLAKRHQIFRGILFESYASSVVINHYRLRGYARWRARVRPLTDGSLWASFDWLEVRARRFLLVRAERSWWKRLALRWRLRHYDSVVLAALEREAELNVSAAAPTEPSAKRRGKPAGSVQALE